MDATERKPDAGPSTSPDPAGAPEKAQHDEKSSTSVETGSGVIGVDEKKLVRKLDLYLIPLVMALYLFSFLDR